ncbi:MAG: trigger factor, partial [Agathobacter sp.]|nr:trigger factor [Agathobacter sp.]
FETLDEYKEDIKKRLEEQKATEGKRAQEDEAIAAIVEKSEMEIPEAMIRTQCEDMVNEFAQRIAQSGLSMEQYMQFSGQTIQGLMAQVRPEAETRIKTSLVLEAIVKEQNIEATDADVDAEIEKMAAMYGMDAAQLKEYMGENEKAGMKRELAITKAVEYIMANVKEKAARKPKKDEAATEEE